MRGGRPGKFIRTTIFAVLLMAAATKTYAQWARVSSNTFITSVETSPWGILIGEFDTRIWLNPPPLNDVYLSKDLGINWMPLGLTGRGVRDLKYFDGKIYAATYYVINGKVGLYYTNDLGKNWQQIGPMFSLSKVNRDLHTIYMGSENRGLWISQDEGNSWTQKIGSGGFGPDIRSIECLDDKTFVTTPDKVYQTTDFGSSWSEVAFLSNKGITHFAQGAGQIFAASYGISGLYRSSDNGQTWMKIQNIGNDVIGDLAFYKGALYTAKVNPNVYDIYTIYSSTDLGNSWNDTQLNVPSGKRVLDLSWAFFDPFYLYAVSLNYGLYRYSPGKGVFETLPFLNLPWKNSKISDLVDKITSFFDHKYPLLAYAYLKETAEENNKTLNFLGEEGSEPNMYYSSHNGIDYGLAYGTEVTAPADGTASYYYCASCGNSIKIVHPNGYESIYMHLQKNGLITEAASVQVNAGDTIGKVGMTGNTNGPHLHFEILKNSKYPDGLSDPYGWLNNASEDPWALFSWTDALGLHNGTKSVYLWNILPAEFTGLAGGSANFVFVNNKSVSWENSSSMTAVINIKNYFQPHLTEFQNNLSYIENTSIKINAHNFLGSEIKSFDEPLEITINFSDADLENILEETIKVYFLDEITGIWKPLPTVLDLISKTAKALTSHLSYFALFGEKEDFHAPETSSEIIGAKSGNVFLEYPALILSSQDLESSPISIFYTFQGEAEWEEYTTPVILNKDGVFDVEFRSMDDKQNIENIQKYTIIADTKNKGKKTVKIKGAEFATSRIF